MYSTQGITDSLVTPMKKYIYFISICLCMLCMGSCRTSQIPPSVKVPTRDDHLALGNPSNATNDPKQVSNFLIQRPTYALSCNATTNLTNWCAWHLSTAWKGGVERYTGQFIPDNTLPQGGFVAKHRDYTNTGSWVLLPK